MPAFPGQPLIFDGHQSAKDVDGLLLPDAHIKVVGGSPPPKATLSTDHKHEFPNPFGAKKNISALSTLIQGKSENTVENPFSAEFSSVSGIGEPNTMSIKIFLPHSEEPLRPLEIVVKKDATVEQVIGFTLYRFCEEGRKPLLDEKLSDVIHWSMRIVEDDGTIDEDFPALDRTRQISKFFFDQFAMCEATPAQVKVNERLRLKKPSREILRKIPSAQNLRRPSATPTPVTNPTQTYNNAGESAGAKLDSPQIPAAPPPPSFHRLKVYFFSPTSTTLSTTIITSVRTTFMDIRSQVCRKWRLQKEDFILIIADTTTEIPLDKTVNDYQKVSELVLLNKGSALGVSAMSLKPNGEINRRGDKPFSLSRSNIPENMDSSRFYKSFKVNRKTRLLGLHERILDIIGDYIHILPSENRGRFDSVKTANYKIRDILICKQSSKNRRKFKLVIDRGLSDSKTYIFIGATVEETTEICNIIKHFMQTSSRDDRSRNFLATTAISPRSYGDSFRSLDLSGAGTPMHPGSK
ncbi:SIN1-domain-containing protein [Basidiobolus meristosporus CBS 931.73]|uniref:SIN1-domain-containing protein n=1 Tax=Basidiobolus meristosporus CBS 931.73 TaxID=1314790 RepID=A0A1Y1Y9N1_9FUNG|nr:SIN1-domain-containing protein [Basidiobolus meristosporus CBS 931.73]|eukprot:ORX94698.1 SIN1-domain-containing protein [Basidiobolus meristosporus CBS 931.73]